MLGYYLADHAYVTADKHCLIHFLQCCSCVFGFILSLISLCSLAAPGVFLICWLPFFVTHILNTHCRTCYVPPGLYSAFTWLGYVNSALNPIIYTTFNIEFRRAFIKILSCWERQRDQEIKMEMRRRSCASTLSWCILVNNDNRCSLVMVKGSKHALCPAGAATRWSKEMNRLGSAVVCNNCKLQNRPNVFLNRAGTLFEQY